MNEPWPERSSHRNRILTSLAALVIIVWAVIEAKRFLETLFGAILFAFLLMPIMQFLRRHRVPEWASLVIVTLVLILPIVFIAVTVGSEVHAIVTDWPRYQSAITNQLHSWLEIPWLQNALAQLGLDSPGEQLGGQASKAIHFMMESLLTVFSVGTEFSLMFFFAIVGVGSRHHLRDSIERVLAARGAAPKIAVLDSAIEVLEKFLAARLAIILFVAAVDFFILKFFGLNYAVTVALILGFSTLIPAIGFFLGVIPPMALALAENHSTGAVGLLFFLLWLVSSIQDHILAPKLLGRHLNLNFLVTYLAIFAGERMWGIAGMFLSVPILAVIQVLLSSSDHLRPWTWLMQGHEEDEKSEAEAG